jgi:hypothetical protein
VYFSASVTCVACERMYSSSATRILRQFDRRVLEHPGTIEQLPEQ